MTQQTKIQTNRPSLGVPANGWNITLVWFLIFSFLLFLWPQFLLTSHLRCNLDFTNGASLAWNLRRRISKVMFTCGWAWPARCPICPILGFWESKVHKNVDSLLGMPMTRCAKFDAASFILGEEIRNRTKEHTNSNRCIHTLPLDMCG